MRSVVDASLLVEAILRPSWGAGVLGGRELHAPSVLDAEVCSALRKMERAGHVGAGSISARLEGYVASSAAVVRHDTRHLVLDAWALRESIWVFDAFYVALARRVGMPLLTVDRRLTSAAPDVAELVS